MEGEETIRRWSLDLRDVPISVREAIKKVARRNRHSINDEVAEILAQFALNQITRDRR